MDAYTFLLLLTASAINMALPGPGIILTFTRSSCRGFAAGAGVSCGWLLASLFLATAALLILSGLMEISQNALAVMRFAGLAVILWMALQLVLAPAAAPSRETAQPRASDFLAGFALGITSPFNLVFLLALLPQFAPERLNMESAAMIILAYLAGQILVLATVSVLGAAAGRALPGGAGVRAFQRVAGATLAGFAIIIVGLPL